MTIEKDEKITITPLRFPKGRNDDFKLCNVIEIKGRNYSILELVFSRNLIFNKDIKKLSCFLEGKENSSYTSGCLGRYKEELNAKLIGHTYPEILKHRPSFQYASLECLLIN